MVMMMSTMVILFESISLILIDVFIASETLRTLDVTISVIMSLDFYLLLNCLKYAVYWEDK